jgi:Arc/MetJ family transcription regulator
MRITVEIDGELLARAHEYTGIGDPAALMNAALRELVQREAARRLARLGGSDPDAEAPPRRRYFDPEPVSPTEPNDD